MHLIATVALLAIVGLLIAVVILASKTKSTLHRNRRRRGLIPTGTGPTGFGQTGPTGFGQTGPAGSAGIGQTGPTGANGGAGFAGSLTIDSDTMLTTAENGFAITIEPQNVVINVNLPPAAGNLGLTYSFFVNVVGTSPVVIHTNGAVFGTVTFPHSAPPAADVFVLNGSGSDIILNGTAVSTGDSLVIYSNGTNWYLTAIGQQDAAFTVI